MMAKNALFAYLTDSDLTRVNFQAHVKGRCHDVDMTIWGSDVSMTKTGVNVKNYADIHIVDSTDDIHATSSMIEGLEMVVWITPDIRILALMGRRKNGMVVFGAADT
jgi:hypothetical protein